MVERELREAFNDCIDRMAAGQSISDCLRIYPQYVSVLRPMLEVGSLVERTQATSFEIAAAQARVRNRVNQRVHTPLPRRRSYGRLAVLAASLLIAFAAVLGAAENSLPGDSLYGVKRLSETARSAVIGEQFGARRLDEIRVLLALKREADVDFSGTVERLDSSDWRVAGLDLEVSAGTQGAAVVTVGDNVRVSAHTTGQGDLIALSLTVLEKGVPPSVTPPLITSPTLLPSSTPTLTVAPTATDTSVPAAPTLSPTAQPVQIETTPVPTGCTPTMPSGWVRYVIQPGDLVALLAQATGVSVEQLIAVNCLPATQMIIVGQTLFLPKFPPATPVPTQPPTSASGASGVQPTSAPVSSGAQPTDDHGGGSGGSGGGHGGGGSDG